MCSSTRITHLTIHNYTLNSHIIEVTEQHSFQGIMLYKSLSWSSHMSNISSKVTITLNFFKCYLSNCSRNPHISHNGETQMEYTSAEWDPNHTYNQKKVQRCAARWIFNDCSRFSSVLAMLNELSLPPLQTHHKISRLQILHKILNRQLAIFIPSYYLPYQ